MEKTKELKRVEGQDCHIMIQKSRPDPYISLADNISLDVVEGIARLKDELKPELMRVVFKDAGFKDDVVKTNTVQILRQHGIQDVKSI